jgi:hypothetical protein
MRYVTQIVILLITCIFIFPACTVVHNPNHTCDYKLKQYNSKKDLVAESFYWADGTPAKNIRGAFKIVYKLTEWGSVLERNAYDSSGKPVGEYYGIFSTRYTYNSFRQKTSESYYDTNLNPAVKQREAYFGGPGPTPCLEDGIHKTVWEFDEHNNLMCKKEYNGYNEPLSDEYDPNSSKGYLTKYYPDGRIKTRTYVSNNYQPVINREGVHLLKYSYSCFPRTETVESYGIDQNPVLWNNSASKVKTIYDYMGNQVAVEYYGLNGELLEKHPINKK